MSEQVVERVSVAATPTRIFETVSDVRGMARRTPECFAVWVWRQDGGLPRRFVGWNRSGVFVWFTTCRVVTADPGREFAFDVTTFGMPVSRWGYRISGGTDACELEEYWLDRRSRGATLLGKVFTGKVARERASANRRNMRRTLDVLKAELES